MTAITIFLLSIDVLWEFFIGLLNKEKSVDGYASCWRISLTSLLSPTVVTDRLLITGLACLLSVFQNSSMKPLFSYCRQLFHELSAFC